MTVTGSTDLPIITWLDDGVEIPSSDLTRNVSAIAVIPSDDSGPTYTRILTFTPLSASHAGMFICAAMLGTVSASNVIVNSKSERGRVYVSYSVSYNILLYKHTHSETIHLLKQAVKPTSIYSC